MLLHRARFAQPWRPLLVLASLGLVALAWVDARRRSGAL
jgi:hypothetical protein